MKNSESSKKTILVACLGPMAPSFEGVLKRLANEAKLQTAVCKTEEEAIKKICDVGAAVLLCHASSNQLLMDHIKTYSKLKQEGIDGCLKVIMTTKIWRSDLAKKLKLFGFSEILAEPVSEKNLFFKVERLARSFEQASVKAGPAKKIQTGSQGHKAEVKSAECLQLGSDFWLIENERPKQFRGAWIVKLRGPASGKWIRHECYWQWRLDDDQTLFKKEEGFWQFKGEKEPELHDDLWWFIDPAPELEFRNGEKCFGKKVWLDPQTGDLIVSADSQTAKNFLPEIEATLKKLIKSKTKTHAAPVKSQTACEWQEPLVANCDCWLVEKQADIRMKRDHWIIELIGPPPSAAKWIRSSNPLFSKTEAWEWQPRDSKHPYLDTSGIWVFQGKKPQFSWSQNKWEFVSKLPTLAFLSDGVLNAHRFNVSGNTLRITQNSSHANSLLTKIAEDIMKDKELLEQGLGMHLLDDSEYTISKEPATDSKVKFCIEPKAVTKGIRFFPKDEEPSSGLSYSYQEENVSKELYYKDKREEASHSFNDKRADTHTDWERYLESSKMEFSVRADGSSAELSGKLIDLYRNELTVRLNENNLRRGEKVTISIKVSSSSTNQQYVVPAVVTEFEDCEDGVHVLFELKDFERTRAILEKFYSVQQGCFTSFLNQARGV